MCVEETFNALAKVWTGRQTHVDQQTQRLFKRKAALGGAFGLAGLTLAGCDVDAPGGTLGKALRFGWPEGVTPEAHAMGNFWVWTWVAAWTLGAIMWGLMLWCLFRQARRKAGQGRIPPPDRIQHWPRAGADGYSDHHRYGHVLLHRPDAG